MRIVSLRLLTAALLGSSFAVLAGRAPAQDDPATGSDTATESIATAAPVIVVSAKRVIVRPGEVIENAKVLIRDGRITAVGTDIDVPAGATELSGEVVCAAFMDPWSIAGVDAASASSTSIAADTQAVEALDPYSQDHVLQQLIESGVLLVRTQVGATADVGGVGAVIRANGVDVVLPDASLSAAIGVSRGFGGGRFRGGPQGLGQLGYGGNFNFGPQSVDPIDRIGQIDKLVNDLNAGQKYGQSVAKYEADLAAWETEIEAAEKKLEEDFKKAKKARDKKVADAKKKGDEHKETKYKEDKRPSPPKFDGEKAAFARAVNGEIPFVVYAQRALEIRELLKATAPFDRLRLIVAGGTSALAVKDMLAERGIPVIVAPSPAAAGGPVGELDPGLSLAGELHAAGVEVLIGSGGSSPGTSRDLPLLAALAVGHGLDRDAALRAITSGPARAFDVADHVGMVKRGHHAELLVLSGDPLSSSSRVLAAISGGAIVHRSAE